MEKEIEELLKKVNGAIDKATEIAPELIQKYIEFKTKWYILEPTFILLFIIVFILITRLTLNKEPEWGDDTKYFGRYGDVLPCGYYVILAFSLMFLLISLFTSLYNLILIDTSPELYLIERFVK